VWKTFFETAEFEVLRGQKSWQSGQLTRPPENTMPFLETEKYGDFLEQEHIAVFLRAGRGEMTFRGTARIKMDCLSDLGRGPSMKH